ncbi:hypothetical protein MRB53_026608 [Persea americana]|uniref:Uncharacterized protein n=1 Tax=Persea americana TaxID=3435 RepID=A0ACC2LJL2_PERAE|nr:hypothetical protein MRB53_026608 [Persea americana]
MRILLLGISQSLGMTVFLVLPNSPIILELDGEEEDGLLGTPKKSEVPEPPSNKIPEAKDRVNKLLRTVKAEPNRSWEMP